MNSTFLNNELLWDLTNINFSSLPVFNLVEVLPVVIVLIEVVGIVVVADA